MGSISLIYVLRLNVMQHLQTLWFPIMQGDENVAKIVIYGCCPVVAVLLALYILKCLKSGKVYVPGSGGTHSSSGTTIFKDEKPFLFRFALGIYTVFDIMLVATVIDPTWIVKVLQIFHVTPTE